MFLATFYLLFCYGFIVVSLVNCLYFTCIFYVIRSGHGSPTPAQRSMCWWGNQIQKSPYAQRSIDSRFRKHRCSLRTILANRAKHKQNSRNTSTPGASSSLNGLFHQVPSNQCFGIITTPSSGIHLCSVTPKLRSNIWMLLNKPFGLLALGVPMSLLFCFGEVINFFSV